MHTEKTVLILHVTVLIINTICSVTRLLWTLFQLVLPVLTDAALFQSGFLTFSIKTPRRFLTAPNSYQLKQLLRELMPPSRWPRVMGGNSEWINYLHASALCWISLQTDTSLFDYKEQTIEELCKLIICTAVFCLSCSQI